MKQLEWDEVQSAGVHMDGDKECACACVWWSGTYLGEPTCLWTGSLYSLVTPKEADGEQARR